MKRYNLTLTHGNNPNHPTPATVESTHGEWVRYEDVNAMALQLDAMSSPTLPKIIAALGWQGGTVEQVVAEVTRMRQFRESVEFYTDMWKDANLDDEGMTLEGTLGRLNLMAKVHATPRQSLGQGVAALLPEHGESR